MPTSPTGPPVRLSSVRIDGIGTDETNATDSAA
jgi:hypothetical protein